MMKPHSRTAKGTLDDPRSALDAALDAWQDDLPEGARLVGELHVTVAALVEVGEGVTP